MRTVGQILKEAREEKFYTLEQVEKATKIRKELLEALEADNYSKLPPPTFVQGFIKNYAKFLGIESGKLLAIFRREFSDKKNPVEVMEAFSNPLEKRKIDITPAKIIGMVIVLCVLSFFVYLWFQYRQFTGAPVLTLSNPQDQVTTDSPDVIVEGKTDPDAKVMVNNQLIAVKEDGSFREDIKLSSQSNKIEVVATSKFGQKTEVQRTVYLKR